MLNAPICTAWLPGLLSGGVRLQPLGGVPVRSVAGRASYTSCRRLRGSDRACDVVLTRPSLLGVVLSVRSFGRWANHM